MVIFGLGQVQQFFVGSHVGASAPKMQRQANEFQFCDSRTIEDRGFEVTSAPQVKARSTPRVEVASAG